jgi:hypothetical protein
MGAASTMPRNGGDRGIYTRGKFGARGDAWGTPNIAPLCLQIRRDMGDRCVGAFFIYCHKNTGIGRNYPGLPGDRAKRPELIRIRQTADAGGRMGAGQIPMTTRIADRQGSSAGNYGISNGQRGKSRPRGSPFFYGNSSPDSSSAGGRYGDTWTTPGAGRGRILPAAEAQTVGQPHENFREMRTGI